MIECSSSNCLPLYAYLLLKKNSTLPQTEDRADIYFNDCNSKAWLLDPCKIYF